MSKVPLIEIKDVNKSFKGRSILENINFSIFEKDFISVSGPSGSGKTTLLNILSCFEFPETGEYYYKGEKIVFKKNKHLIKTDFGFIFQNYNLIPGYTAKENIALPFHYQNINNEIIEKIDGENKALFNKLGINNIINENVENLSGGEKQRVAIGRALIKKPKIIFADEPTGNLDQENKKIVLNLLKSLNEELGIAIIIVTHDSYVSSFTKKAYYIKEKHIYAQKKKSK